MRTNTSRNAWFALAAITVLTACASAGQDAAAISTRNERVQIHIENHNWQDVAVWAVAAGSRVRLGTVVTGETGRFVLPHHFAVRANSVQLEGHRIGSDDSFTSDMFLVTPGSRLVWRVENQLGLSSQFIESR